MTETLKPPPKKLGVTHWSTRLLGERLKVSNTTIARAWRASGIKPWKAESFRFSTDPELVGKVTDICGLYLAPPQNAIVADNCALRGREVPDPGSRPDRADPADAGGPDRAEVARLLPPRHRHAVRGADIATGQVTAALKKRHRHQEFLAFLKQIERTYRDVVNEDGDPIELHLVMDNYAAHKRVNVRAWLAENPRFKIHFTPTHASWVNLVEVLFGIVERQAIRRGVFQSVKDLNTKIRAFIDGWNDRSHPFV